MKTYFGKITSLLPHQIFVFGSNRGGIHGKGAALTALKCFGAKYGQAKGRQGQSYAIITKDLTKKIHPSVLQEEIIEQIIEFYEYVGSHPELEFYVAYSGTGKNLNGYTPSEMAELFWIDGIPNNVVFEEKFYELIKNI